jgi:hypothetical protein
MTTANEITATNLIYGPLGQYVLDAGFQIDGNKVRFWATKKQAVTAAKAIGWPVKSVERVHTRFQIGYAIADTRFGALSRESYGALFADAQKGKSQTN